MIEILLCSTRDLEAEPNIRVLLEEYAAECSLPELGEIGSGDVAQAQLERYCQLEAAGALHPIAAYVEGHLVGFVCVLLSVLPHYGKILAVTESIFVAREHRKTGIGLMLEKAAKDLARDKGAIAIQWIAPVGSDFSQYLHAKAARGSCRHTNEAFTESLA